MAGTLNAADVYGVPSDTVQFAAPISAAGPGQSYLGSAFSNPGTGAYGGGTGSSAGNAPTFSLLGLVLGLVLLRVAIELSDRA